MAVIMIMIMIMMVFHVIVFVMQRYLAVMIPEIPKNRYTRPGLVRKTVQSEMKQAVYLTHTNHGKKAAHQTRFGSS